MPAPNTGTPYPFISSIIIGVGPSFGRAMSRLALIGIDRLEAHPVHVLDIPKESVLSFRNYLDFIRDNGEVPHNVVTRLTHDTQYGTSFIKFEAVHLTSDEQREIVERRIIQGLPYRALYS